MEDQNKNNKTKINEQMNLDKMISKNPKLYDKNSTSLNKDIHFNNKISNLNMNKINKYNIIKNIETKGYKVANKIHKIATLSLITFTLCNIIYCFKKYNDYCKKRRQVYLN